MNTTNINITRPRDVAAAGQSIYDERYKAEYEEKYFGQFAAIDVISGDAFVAEFPEEVLEEARAKKPTGIFHLIKIGFAGAFRTSSLAPCNARNNWLFQ